MKIVQQTIASLGSPMWIERLEQPCVSTAVIARWRHLNGSLRISTADAIRVCLSLSTGQQVRHTERDRALSKSVLAGDVIVLRSGTDQAFPPKRRLRATPRSFRSSSSLRALDTWRATRGRGDSSRPRAI